MQENDGGAVNTEVLKPQFAGDTPPCESVVNLDRRADAMLRMCWGDSDITDAVGEGRARICGTRGMARRNPSDGVRDCRNTALMMVKGKVSPLLQKDAGV